MQESSPETAEPPPPLASFNQPPPPYNPYQQGNSDNFLFDIKVLENIPAKGVNNQAFVDGLTTTTQPTPQTITVQQDTEHVPGLFEVGSKSWCIYCLTGCIMSECIGCYLGTKYQVGPFKSIRARNRTL